LKEICLKYLSIDKHAYKYGLFDALLQDKYENYIPNLHNYFREK